MRTELLDIVSGFTGIYALVVGDVMLDEYIWGDVNRISPEAPVPIVQVRKSQNQLGGAANVGNNIHHLGGKAGICGIVGNDQLGRALIDLMRKNSLDANGVFSVPDRVTTHKVRVVAHNQHVVRVDRELVGPLPEQTRELILKYIEKKIRSVDCIVISDYGKGVIDRDLLVAIQKASAAAGKFCTIDPKTNHLNIYRNISIITPNHIEAGKAVGITIRNYEDICEVGKLLLDKSGCKGILITWGANGMVLFEQEKAPVRIETVAREVYDVTGAGDTVIAVLTMALAAGATFPQAAKLANLAAGLAVAEVGTSTISQDKLRAALERL